MSLIDSCCTFNIHILNGRFPSDAEGHFTCIAHQGASIVDYLISSSELFNYISDFTVLDNDNSDHFPITCSITLQAETENIVANSDKMKCELFPFKRFKWRPEHSDKFKTKFHQLFNNFCHNLPDSASVLPLLGVFNGVYESAADVMNSTTTTFTSFNSFSSVNKRSQIGIETAIAKEEFPEKIKVNRL